MARATRFQALGCSTRTHSRVLLAAMCAVACSGNDDIVGPGTGGALGSVGGANVGGGANGGTNFTGGRSGLGGSTSTGGGSSSGGNVATGGTPATGGGTAKGGGTATGGKASGGMSSSGGRATGGQVTATGGIASGQGGTAQGKGGTSTGGSGTTQKPEICKFANGMNIAWVSFARDVPNPNIGAFQAIFKKTYDAGGRVLRWWFHTNGTVTPGYDSSGMAKKLDQSHVDGIKAILGAADAAGVSVVLSLWSFDMLQSNAGGAINNNKALLENDANRQAYVDNYLTPLVTAIKGTPGLYAWEIFNEPEGMSPTGWATSRTTMVAIQKTVNWLTAAIRDADPAALVTNGAQTFDYCSNVSGKRNYYSDSQLRSVGGKQNGILDFYQVHYYTSNGSSNSPFTRPASYWGLDKPLVMGEFYPNATDGVAVGDLHKKLHDIGYVGAWSWSNTDAAWSNLQSAMQGVAQAYPDVKNCP